MSRADRWTRAPEATRCKETATFPPHTGIGTVRCDHKEGHDGNCGYLTVAGIIVEWQDVPENKTAARGLEGAIPDSGSTYGG